MARAARIAGFLLRWLLPAAMPLLWGLSYLRGDTIIWLRSGHHSIVVASFWGQCGLTVLEVGLADDAPPQLLRLNDRRLADAIINWDDGSSQPIHGVHWLHWTRIPVGEGVFGPGVFGVAPHWLLSLPGLLLIAAAAHRQFRGRRRRTLGLCVVCGYDLRESRGRCPECGTVISPLRA